MKTRIKVPPTHKLRRAIRRASRPRFGAACIWCGHGYRLWQYTRAAEDAHLLKCPGFPERGKQQIRDMQEAKREAKLLSC